MSLADLTSSSALKKRKSVAGTELTTENSDEKVVVEHKTDSAAVALFETIEEWPFEGLCEQLCLDLFSPYWEVRHGASLALKELLKSQGSGAGKILDVSVQENQNRNAKWVGDLAIRLLCVLALDKFSDFVGDQAVVPVRETCAQALGVLSQYATPELCSNIVHQGLLSLIQEANSHRQAEQQQWGVRLAALTGLKYILAVRTDLIKYLLVDSQGEFSDTLQTVIRG